MASDDSIPWHNRPPRPFPVHIWLLERYGFRLPPMRFAPPDSLASQHSQGRRPFPAQVWALGQHRAGRAPTP